MKVLQINAFCGRGSTGRIVTDISKTFKDEDECYIAYGFFDGKYDKSYKTLKGKGLLQVKYCLMITRLFGWSGFSNRYNTKKLLKWIDNINPDIIHLHNIHGDYLHIGVLFKYLKKSGKPIVWTLHDCWSITGRCAYFDYVGCDKWQSGCHNCQNMNTYPISYFFDFSKPQWKIKRKLFTQVDNMTIVTPSQWLADLVSKSYLKDYPIQVIHNGIDVSVFKPTGNNGLLRKKYNLEDKFIILGVASSWTHRKGLDFFIELSDLLDDDCKIVLIGLKDSKIKTLPLNIIGLERTENVEELANWYSTADVFVNPTLEDNYPTTNLEAQACGTPVVTFETGGSPENVLNGEVVREKNAIELKEAILRIKNRKIVPNTVETEKFSKECCVKQYYELYEKLLEKRRGKFEKQ
jgi:glycosyltransferase involved in cell wall biosynthesis